MKCITARALIVPILLVVLSLCVTGHALAQNQTTAEISGIVIDASSATVPNAVITAIKKETGIERTTHSNSDGQYTLPLLPPGTYMLTVKAQGFQTVTREGIAVAIDQTVRVDFRLQVGSVTAAIEVQTEAPMIETSNPNTTTTIDERDLQNLPNPGQDLTYVANVAPGAIMNVNSSNGYNGGNVEFNGLPSIANDFTIDGLDANDAWQSTNRSGASGLTLGLNSVQEASVNTESYAADLGRLGASQINYITKSGANAFHGNAYEIWNGSSMNATNFFIKANPVPTKKPFSNTNEFGANLGGRILKDKLFFFTDFEGIRIVLPQILTATLPSPAYQQYVLQQLNVGGFDPASGQNLPAQPGEIPLYQQLFNLVGTPAGTAQVIPDCPLGTNGDGCAIQRLFTASPPVSETLWTLKLDYVLSSKDTFWFRYQMNRGANTRVDAVNPVFNVVDKEPEDAASANWTHVFGPSLVNQFNPGISYQDRVHNLANPTEAQELPVASLPEFGFSSIGGTLGNIPYGDRTTTWQLNDNLSWTLGKHTLKFGENLRRVLFSSAESEGYAVTPYAYQCSLAEFTYGAACQTYEAFPTYGVDHLKGVGLDLYAMDSYRVRPNVTVTLGVRASWNSNPVSQENVLARLVTPFARLDHDVDTPLNQAILGHQHHMFEETPLIIWQPRAAIAWEVRPKTVLRVGAGVFTNPIMGFLPSYLDENAPSDVFFQGGLFGPVGGSAIAPGVPDSAIDAAGAADQAFQAGFANGALSCASSMAGANCIPQVSFTTFESKRQKLPMFYQWSLGIDQQLGSTFLFSIKYVGTHASDMFYSDSPNGYQSVCDGCWNGYPYNAPPDARFGNIFPFQTGVGSSYNGLQTNLTKRFGNGLSFQVNYTYSHCLDYISNGGVEIFNENENFSAYNGQVSKLYGNCDFDVRHSVNGSYVYSLPFKFSNRVLNQVAGGWQVSGTVYLRGGFPFSVLSQSPSGFTNAYPTVFSNLVPGQSLYAKKDIAGVTLPGSIQWLNPNAFQSVIDSTTFNCYPVTNATNCQNGDVGRNTLRAPGFKWTDFDLTKRFQIRERLSLRFDAQFYNLFNHPNFGFPNSNGYPGNATAGIPGEAQTLAGFGNINTTVGPSTGLLGAGLGGDSSVRMIALRAGFEF
jgi:carboxypeptidase family protein